MLVFASANDRAPVKCTKKLPVTSGALTYNADALVLPVKMQMSLLEAGGKPVIQSMGAVVQLYKRKAASSASCTVQLLFLLDLGSKKGSISNNDLAIRDTKYIDNVLSNNYDDGLVKWQ